MTSLVESAINCFVFFGIVVYGIPQAAASPWGQLPLTVLKTISVVATGILGNLFKCQYKTKLF